MELAASSVKCRDSTDANDVRRSSAGPLSHAGIIHASLGVQRHLRRHSARDALLPPGKRIPNRRAV